MSRILFLYYRFKWGFQYHNEETQAHAYASVSICSHHHVWNYESMYLLLPNASVGEFTTIAKCINQLCYTHRQHNDCRKSFLFLTFKEAKLTKINYQWSSIQSLCYCNIHFHLNTVIKWLSFMLQTNETPTWEHELKYFNVQTSFLSPFIFR